MDFRFLEWHLSLSFVLRIFLKGLLTYCTLRLESPGCVLIAMVQKAKIAWSVLSISCLLCGVYILFGYDYLLVD